MIRPGEKRVALQGGLHEFMNCPLPILTDSGGYQVMSLSKLNKIDREKGAIFNSHIDGKQFILSPEESIRIQKKLNSDIVMVMDECPKKTTDKNYPSNGNASLCGVIVDADDNSGLANKAESFIFNGEHKIGI